MSFDIFSKFMYWTTLLRELLSVYVTLNAIHVTSTTVCGNCRSFPIHRSLLLLLRRLRRRWLVSIKFRSSSWACVSSEDPELPMSPEVWSAVQCVPTIQTFLWRRGTDDASSWPSAPYRTPACCDRGLRHSRHAATNAKVRLGSKRMMKDPWDLFDLHLKNYHMYNIKRIKYVCRLYVQYRKETGNKI